MLTYLSILLLSLQAIHITAKYNPLTPTNTAVLLIEMQSGLLTGVADQTQAEFRNSLSGVIGLIQAFSLPTVITTINEPINGPLLPELAAAFPNAPVIRRQGEINAWDNDEVVKAIKNTKREKLLVAGISTDGCVALASIAAKDAGYDVYALIDASGTWSKLIQQLAIQRMLANGVMPVNWFAVAGELQKDWRNPTAGALFGVVAKHLPFYGNLVDLYYAKSNQ